MTDERLEQIEDASYESLNHRKNATYWVVQERKSAFTEGAVWADEHPSDEAIDKILWIWTHSDISTNEEVNTNDYIRKHWNDNFD